MENIASEIFSPVDLKNLELAGNSVEDRLLLRYREFRLWEGKAPVSVPEDEKLVEHFNDLKGGGFNRLTDITVPHLAVSGCIDGMGSWGFSQGKSLVLRVWEEGSREPFVD